MCPSSSGRDPLAVSHLVLAAGIRGADDVVALQADQGAPSPEVTLRTQKSEPPSTRVRKTPPRIYLASQSRREAGWLGLGSQVCRSPTSSLPM